MKVSIAMLCSENFISHIKTGQIMPIRDSNAIAEALKLYIENPELLEEHSKNILSIRDYLDVNRYERDILNLFSEIEHNG
ncbi:MAG: hypothetical protein ACPLW7_05600 [Minisyncoccia bacterium]